MVTRNWKKYFRNQQPAGTLREVKGIFSMKVVCTALLWVLG